jgi:hypothetical protein
MQSWTILRAGGLLLALAAVGCDDAKDLVTTTEQVTGRRVAETVDGVELTELVDGLFMGSGPLVPRSGSPACPVTRTWTGFPRGTAVTVRISTSVPDDARAALQRVVGQVASATNGVIVATSASTPADDPVPGTNQVAVSVRARPRDAGCPSDRGCVHYGFRAPGILEWARAVEAPDQPVQAFLRDAVGRGILGLCQVDATRIGGPGASLMSEGGGRVDGAALALTNLDIAAIRAVYDSPLSPGAGRNDFLQAGLVTVQAGQRARGSAVR